MKTSRSTQRSCEGHHSIKGGLKQGTNAGNINNWSLRGSDPNAYQGKGISKDLGAMDTSTLALDQATNSSGPQLIRLQGS